jgi:hypothetical protein
MLTAIAQRTMNSSVTITDLAEHLRRSQHQLLETQRQSVENIVNGYNDDTHKEETESSDSDMQPLLQAIIDIYESDAAGDNLLHMCGFITTNFSKFDIIGQGTTFLVRDIADDELSDFIPGHYSSSVRLDYPFESKRYVSKQLLLPRQFIDRQKRKTLLTRVIQELKVLCHRPLRRHENILDFAGLMWETVDDYIWPVLRLERADYGTLAQFQSQPLRLTFATKQNLLLDYGRALLALHACGLIHGDVRELLVKPNVHTMTSANLSHIR